MKARKINFSQTEYDTNRSFPRGVVWFDENDDMRVSDGVTPNGIVLTGNAPRTIYPTAGSGSAGIVFPNNPGGGSGDAASIKYYAADGETMVLDISVLNDYDDRIKISASGDVSINAGEQGYTFSSSGALVLPDGTSIIGSGIYAASGSNAVLGQYDALTQIYTMNSGIGLQTQIGGTYSTWLFEPAGTMTMPSGVIDSFGGNFELRQVGEINLKANQSLNIMTDGGTRQWTFGSNGILIAPTASRIDTGYAGLTILSDSGASSPNPGDLLNSALYVSAGQVSIAYNQESSMGGPESRYQWDFNSTYGSLQLPTNGAGIQFGDGTTQSTAFKGIFATSAYLTFPDSTTQSTAWTGGRVVSIPNSSLGTSGDLAGDIAFSPNHIFYCFQDFAGTVITMESITSSIMSHSFLIMYDNSAGFTSADLTGYSVSGPAGYSGTVSGPSQDQGGGMWYVPITPDIYQQYGNYVFTSPSGNIWKRLAWSNDTW